jgi:mono/diheme cytochrome c family protein
MPTRIVKRPSQAGDTPLLVALFAVALAVSAIFWYGARLHGPDSVASTGELLYTQYCAGCHGFRGEGNSALNAPALNSTGTLYQYTDGEIQRAILTGGEIMPKHDQILSATQAADIILYIQTWWTDEQFAAQQILSQQDPLQP